METKKSGQIKRVMAKLAVVFEIVDIGCISHYLGWKIKINCLKQLLKLFQPTNIKKSSKISSLSCKTI